MLVVDTLRFTVELDTARWVMQELDRTEAAAAGIEEEEGEEEEEGQETQYTAGTLL